LRLGAAVVSALLLATGFCARHVHDSDGLFYRTLGRRIAQSGEWWQLSLSPDVLDPFTDHMAPAFWWVAVLWKIGGDHLVTAGSFTLTVIAAWAWVKVMQRMGLGAAAPVFLVLWACTDSWMRVIGEPRLEAPYLALQSLAVLLATRATVGRLLLAGILCGLGVIFRGPVALALLPIVWLALSEKRAALVAMYLIGFAGVVAMLFVLADRAGALENITRYWDLQVLASLRGSRTDGEGSHLGPLKGLLMTCWPAMALIPLLLVPRFRAGARLSFFALTALFYLVGLSLGARHVPNHMWPAYPALLTLAAVPGSRLLAWMPRLRGLPYVAAIVAVVLALTKTSASCDIAAIDRATVCNPVFVDMAGGDKQWQRIQVVAHHLQRDVTFDPAAVGRGHCQSLRVSLDDAVGTIVNGGTTSIGHVRLQTSTSK